MLMTFEEVRDLVTRIDRDRRPVPALEAADVVHLRRLAQDPDVGIAMDAVALAASVPGPEALEILADASASPHEEIRVVAAATLWRYGPGADDLAVGLLLDPDPGVRRFALRSQARRAWTDPATPVPARTRLVVDAIAVRADPVGRLLAASVAARMRGRPPSVAEVHRLLESTLPSGDVADVIGPQSTEPVLELIRSTDARLASEVVDVAGEFAGDQTPLLLAAAEHPDPNVRLRAGRALAHAGSRGGEEPLLRLLNDEDPGIRMQALVAALRFRQTPKISGRVRQMASQDPVEAIRDRARQAIERLPR